MEIEEQILNSKLIKDHFGYWLLFHDSEVVSLKFERTLDRSNSSIEMTNQIVENYYQLVKHCFINFEFDEIHSCEIDGFNHQNALFALRFNKKDESFVCEIESAYGVNGYIESKKVKVTKLELIEDPK